MKTNKELNKETNKEFTTQRISSKNMEKVKLMRKILNSLKDKNSLLNYNKLTFDEMISIALNKFLEAQPKIK